ncbi:MAG: hypothetical protein ACXIVQ_16060 [Acidimicrobiales bacterium]
MTPAVELTCPSCGTISHFDSVRRSAEEFCRRCDYPLFWVRSGESAPDADAEGDVGLRRLPGAGGHQVVASLGCPQCNEPNLSSASLCIRCGADLRPAPAAPAPVPTVVPVPVAPPPPPPPEPELGPQWPAMVAFIGVPILVALLLLTLID